MHVKKIFILIYLALTSLLSYSQHAGKKDANQKKLHKTPVAQAKTLLWQISGNGLSEPSYLFGTIHIMCANDAVVSPELNAVVTKAKDIYLELDMDDMQQMAGALKFLRMNDGMKLSDLLSEEEFKRLETYFKTHKSVMPFSMMNRFKPYFISSLVGEDFMDCPTKKGMEQAIMDKAKTGNKEIKGLETLEFQAGIFDSIPYAKQAKDLINYIDSAASYGNVMAEMLQVYKAQDIEAMQALTARSDPGMESYMDLLLYSRNRNWVKQLPAIMSNGTHLFAVGAGHLGGEQGLLNLLRQQGYTVTPMKNTIK